MNIERLTDAEIRRRRHDRMAERALSLAAWLWAIIGALTIVFGITLLCYVVWLVTR